MEAAEGPPNAISIDLWKFFEERGGKLKESMFQVVTWILGFAAVVLGFAFKEGFASGLAGVKYPILLVALGLAGLVLLAHAVIVILDYGRHINRTFARANVARDGEWLPRRIWDAGQSAETEPLPHVCWHLLIVVGLFAISFTVITLLGICTAGFLLKST